MKITNDEFEVLVCIEKKTNKIYDCKQISEKTNIGIEEINKICLKLLDEKLIQKDDENKFTITENGYKELEPYRVKKAIFLAAGFGSRMMPVTKNIPKPMVKINNKMIIETLLDAAVEAEIEDIIIVRGYLSEKFDELKEKYPNIKFIDNYMYNTTNNISSAYLAREFMDNAYVLEADLYLYNKDVIRKYEYTSNYLGKYVRETDDYSFITEGKKINGVKLTGKDCYQMYCISYLTKKDGDNLKNDIVEYFENPNKSKNIFLENLLLGECKENYNFEIRECKQSDIIEIDTFEELKQLDSSYNKFQIKL